MVKSKIAARVARDIEDQLADDRIYRYQYDIKPGYKGAGLIGVSPPKPKRITKQIFPSGDKLRRQVHNLDWNTPGMNHKVDVDRELY